MDLPCLIKTNIWLNSMSMPESIPCKATIIVTCPMSVSMVLGSPVASRKESGGIKTSFSPGNSERKESGAPRSIEPASNSNRIGRPFDVADGLLVGGARHEGKLGVSN